MQNAPGPTLALAKQRQRILVSLPIMDDNGLIQLYGKIQLLGKKTFLNISRGKIIVVIQPNFAQRLAFGMAQQHRKPIQHIRRRILRFMGMNTRGRV